MVWPVVAAVAGGLINHASEKSRVREQNRLNMGELLRTRKAAEEAGFHPLEALRAGATVQQSAGPRLMSSLMASGAFDALEDELTGERAKREKRAEVDDEIRELERQRLRFNVARMQISDSSLDGGVPGGLKRPPIREGRYDREGAESNPVFLDDEIPLAPSPAEAIIKPFAAPDGTAIPMVEDWDQAVQALILYGPARLERSYRESFEEAKQDPEEVYRLYQNFKKNNPRMSDADIRAHIKTILGTN